MPSPDGPRWNEQRRFALTVLKEFGFGQNVMENEIRAELADLITAISAASLSDQVNNKSSEQVTYRSTPIDPLQFLQRSIYNVISVLVFGSRLGGRDPSFDRRADFINNVPKPKMWQFIFLKYVYLLKKLFKK